LYRRLVPPSLPHVHQYRFGANRSGVPHCTRGCNTTYKSLNSQRSAGSNPAGGLGDACGTGFAIDGAGNKILLAKLEDNFASWASLTANEAEYCLASGTPLWVHPIGYPNNAHYPTMPNYRPVLSASQTVAVCSNPLVRRARFGNIPGRNTTAIIHLCRLTNMSVPSAGTSLRGFNPLRTSRWLFAHRTFAHRRNGVVAV